MKAFILRFFLNWKTSSLGFSIILGAVIDLIYAVATGDADRTTWKNDILIACGGIAALIAADASTVSRVQTQVNANTDKLTVVAGDTARLKRDSAEK